MTPSLQSLIQEELQKLENTVVYDTRELHPYFIESITCIVESAFREVMPDDRKFQDGDIKNASDYGFNTALTQIMKNMIAFLGK